ncbi:MAG: FadR/GntR family transcriptional regulator [Paracoccaceae bacterium]
MGELLQQKDNTRIWANEDLLQHLRPLEPGGNVLDALIEMIEAADLKIGDRLPPEILMAKRLGVGRSTIREAIKAWQSMGIVVRNKGAGTTLAAEISSTSLNIPLTLKLEAESLLRTEAVRRPLEIEAVRIATLKATLQQRKIITARMAELMAVYEAGEDWRDADARFHRSIHDASGNPLFQKLISQIQKAFHEVYQDPFDQPRLGERTIPMHRQLSEAITEGNVIEAVHITTEIMNQVDSDIRRTMESHNGG